MRKYLIITITTLIVLFFGPIVFFNDMIARNTFLVGNYLPVFVSGGLLLICIAMSPLRKRFMLSRLELGFATAVILFACGVPGRGLMHYFNTSLMMPHTFGTNNLTWQGDLPQYAHEGVLDWQKLSKLLQHEMAQKDELAVILKKHIGEYDFSIIQKFNEGEESSSEVIEAQLKLVKIINSLLGRSEFIGAIRMRNLELPFYAKRLLARDEELLRPIDKRVLSRVALDVMLEGAVEPRYASAYEIVPDRLYVPVFDTSVFLTKQDITNWALLGKTLAGASASGDVNLKTLASLFDDEVLELAKSWSPTETEGTIANKYSSDESEKNRLLKILRAKQEVMLQNLNKLINHGALLYKPTTQDGPSEFHFKALLARADTDLSSSQLRRLNRRLLELKFSNAIRQRKSCSDRLASEFAVGLGHDKSSDIAGRIPWGLWLYTWAFWGVLLGSFALLSIGLVMVLQKQWREHENLQYPISDFLNSFLPNQEGGVAKILRTPAFWVATIIIFSIHLINYTSAWLPEYVPSIPRNINFLPLLKLFPTIDKGGWAKWSVFNATIYPTAIGFGFLIARDVSLSLGVAPLIYLYIMGTLASVGIASTGSISSPGMQPSLYAGSFLAMFILIIWSGRRFYLSAFAQAMGKKHGDEVPRYTVLGARITLIAGLVLFGTFLYAGISIFMSLLLLLVGLSIIVGSSRLVAEAGVIFLHPWFIPSAAFIGMFGAMSIGADHLIPLVAISIILFREPREAFMPFIITALDLGKRTGSPPVRIAKWGTIALFAALIISTPVCTYILYNYGATNTNDGWAYSGVPQETLRSSEQSRRKLLEIGQLHNSNKLSVTEKLSSIKPEKYANLAFFIAFSLVFFFSFLRHRYAWWPLHPLLFLVLGTWQCAVMAGSFLLGWLIKTLVVKYGGGEVFNKAKMIMMGFIAGDLIMAIITSLIGLVYYIATGDKAPSFRIMPG